MLLEICANSFTSAINAQKAGAHRIELCAELAVGGITPSYGLIKKVVEALTIPIHVLIRPRSGDFTYSSEEFSIMLEDIALCKELGCAGIVSGVLHKNQQLDMERTKELIEASKPLSFTFHRAFDWVSNPIKTAIQLSNLGANRILSSGQASSALEGIELLKQVRQKVGEQLVIMPGGGVKASNVVYFKEAGFTEIHCSATRLHQTIDSPKISMNSSKFLSDTHVAVSDEAIIGDVLKGFVR